MNISFEYEGILFSGVLSKVTGGASNALYHLYIDNYYRGQLWKTDKGWMFGSNDGMFEDIGWWFGELVENNLNDIK